MITEKIQYKEIFEISKRLGIIIFLLLGLFGVIFLRLIYLQVIRSAKYWELANNNSIRIIQKKAPRGNILDRNNNKIVYNVPSYNVIVIPADIKDKDFLVNRLSKILRMDGQEIKNKIDKYDKNTIDTVIIKEDCDSKTISIVEEEKHILSGVLVLVESKRTYSDGLAFHTLGYVSEVTDMELILSNSENNPYSIRDMVGRTGVEQQCDKTLRGVNGDIRILVDATGRKSKLVGSSEPIKGKDVVLTIDGRLQKIVEENIKGLVGSIIVMKPFTGEILAIASSPTVNLEKFSYGLTKSEWDAINNNPKHPLHNRSISGLYSFGSTFKVLTAIAALEKGIIDEHTRFFCNGKFWFSNWDYDCWKKDGHGNVDIYRAIAESCDVYFYNVGLKLSVENLNKFAFKFGLGELTGIDISGEKKGLVPTPEWKEKREGIPWFPGNTIQLSIGQGYVLATPLQMLVMFNIVATGGVFYKPHVLMNNDVGNGKRAIELSKENIEIIKKALQLVVKSGTGFRANVSGVNVAGKTSTIENPHGRTHAGFIAFAPVESPDVSIIVFLEGGGEGGSAAAPIAGNILRAYFDNDKIN